VSTKATSGAGFQLGPAPQETSENHALEFAHGVMAGDDPRADEWVQGFTYGAGDKANAYLYDMATRIANVPDEVMGRQVQFGGDEAYDAMMQAQKEKLGAYESQNPWGATAAQASGAAMNPLSYLGGEYLKGAQGLTGIPRIASGAFRSGVIGGAYGGVSGFFEGDHDLYERVIDAFSGAGWGAGGAGLLHAGGAGALSTSTALSKFAGQAFSSVFKQLWGMTPAEAGQHFPKEMLVKAKEEALEWIKDRLAKNPAAREKLTTHPAVQMGKPISAGEAMGKEFEGQMATLARRHGKTPDLAESEMYTRSTGRGERIREDLARATGIDPNTSEQNIDQMVTRMRNAAAPWYRRVYSGPAPNLLTNHVLAGLMDRPTMQAALQQAIRLMRDEGVNPTTLGILRTIREAGQVHEGTGLRMMHETGMPIGEHVEFHVQNPTMQTWDYIKRGLDDVAERYRDKTTLRIEGSNEARNVLNMLNTVRSELTNPETPWGPNYARALHESGEAIRIREAFKTSTKLLSSKTTPYQFEQLWGRMGPAEREAAKHGLVAKIANDIEQGAVTPIEAKRPAFLNRLTQMLGGDEHAAQSARAFVNQTLQEMKLAGAEQRIPASKGSATYGLLSAGHDFDKWHMARRMAGRLASGDVRHAVGGLIGDLVFEGFQAHQLPQNEATRNALGEFLFSNPEELLKVLQESVSPTPTGKQKLLKLLGQIGAAGGRQAAVHAPPLLQERGFQGKGYYAPLDKPQIVPQGQDNSEISTKLDDMQQQMNDIQAGQQDASGSQEAPAASDDSSSSDDTTTPQ
jgi:hypothetical protein